MLVIKNDGVWPNKIKLNNKSRKYFVFVLNAANVELKCCTLHFNEQLLLNNNE